MPEFHCSCTYVELYNEEVRDLLQKNKLTEGGIQLREDTRGEVILSGVHEPAVTTVEEALAYLTFGSKQRETATTAMNERSSRSHAIFTFTMHQTTAKRRSRVGEDLHNALAGIVGAGGTDEVVDIDGDDDGERMTVVSKIAFVDLSG